MIDIYIGLVECWGICGGVGVVFVLYGWLWQDIDKIYRMLQLYNGMIESEKVRNFTSGLLAGFISVTICNPLDITRTRLNIMNSPNHPGDKYTSFMQTVKTIYREEGFKGLYSGYRTNMIAIPLFHSLFFPIYESLKQYFYSKGYSPTAQYCLSTLIAGVTCNILTNPIWIVRTRLMVQYLHPEHKHYPNDKPMHIIYQIYQQEGFSSFAKGLSPSILSVSNAMVYFVCYESLNAKMHADLQYSANKIFITSTVSKIISSSITYPLIVIRTILHDHRSQTKLPILGLIRHVLQDNGIWGFYAGLKTDLIRLIPSNAILFITYEYLKRVFFVKPPHH